MHVLILGAGGMIGRKLVAEIVAGGMAASHLTLVDLVAPVAPGFAGPCDCLALDLSQPGVAAQVAALRPDVILHLAAIVSSEAEADFAKGYAINLDGTRALLEAIRALPGYCPKVIFASSIAVFGAPFAAVIPDDFHLTPRSSYGTQKAMTELLLADYSRRGFIDGLALRLPTICIRPGLPNKAASSFFSGILREPLAGKPAVLPVRDTVRHWFASPRAAVGFFLHAAGLETAVLGQARALNMPGLSATVAEQIEALRRVAGQGAVDLIRLEPDAAIAAIVDTWPEDFTAMQASALGFVAEREFDEIIRIYLDEDAPPSPFVPA